jgi:protein farnesyltransferase subunit beta
LTYATDCHCQLILIYQLLLFHLEGFISLSASRPWLSYWMLHALYLLKRPIPPSLQARVVLTLSAFQSPTTGGIAGGMSQVSHCAPTYAGILSLCSLATDAALSAIDRKGLYRFFMSVKHASGGFRMHRDGEVDCRGTYTVISIARLVNILTPELVAGVVPYLLSCQTYEGGFGGEVR